MRLSEIIDERGFLIVASVPVRDARRCIDMARRALDLGSDVVELRLDYLGASELKEDVVDHIVGSVEGLKIVTIREVDEGGVNEIPLERKVEILERLSGRDDVFVDVELSFLRRSGLSLRGFSGVILSHHYISAAPRLHELLSELSEAREIGADVYKVAFTCRDATDVLSPLSLLVMSSALKRPHLAVLPMGTRCGRGDVSAYRLAFLLMGSRILYCSVEEKTAQGQMDLKRCVEFKRVVEGLRL